MLVERLVYVEPGLRINRRTKHGNVFDYLITDQHSMPLAHVVGGATGEIRFTRGVYPDTPVAAQIRAAWNKLWAPRESGWPGDMGA
jgi:hypothetical protein